MLTNNQLYILYLLRKSFDLPCEYVKPGDVTDLAHVIRKTGIILTVYPTIKMEGPEVKALEEGLRSHYYATLRQIANQEREGKQILTALGDAGFECIALKGWELRKCYPKKYMRQMADLDILVRPYEFNKVKTVMEDLGYLSEGESSGMHDNFKKAVITVEMHKRLTDDMGMIRAWEKGMWNRVFSVAGNVYKMSDEDYYIFHFVHLHKDFMRGMLGIRRIVDTWLLQKQQRDMIFVKQELEKLGMWTFHEKMLHLSRVAMGEENMDDDAEFLLKHAFTYGIYGTMKSYKVNFITSMGNDVRSGKLKAWLWAVFLPYRRMKVLFPVLKKNPLLLPFCWIWRIIRILKGDVRGKIKKFGLNDLTEDDYNEMRRFYKAGGI